MGHPRRVKRKRRRTKNLRLYYQDSIFISQELLTGFADDNTTVYLSNLQLKGGASQVVLMVKNPPANAGDIRAVGSIPGSGRSPGGGHGYPLQYSCLEDLMERGAWWATYSPVGCKESDTNDSLSYPYCGILTVIFSLCVSLF